MQNIEECFNRDGICNRRWQVQVKFISDIMGFVVDLLCSSSILLGVKKKKVMCAVLNNSLYTEKTQED